MWFSKSIEESLEEFKVDLSLGLTEEEAAVRLKKYGINKLHAKKKKSILKMFISQLHDWLIYILFAAVLITLFLGEYIDATIIILVIITNAALGVAQQIKADRAIEALRKMSFPKALVRRNGIVKEIDSGHVVPGDVIILDAGRFIAADLRLIESANLQIDESALTGESIPSDKDASLIHDDPKTPLGDRANTAFMSTLVTRGRGIGLVIETGMNTEIGKIANLIISAKKSKTPLEIRLDQLGKILGKFAIGTCVVIFLIAMLQGRDLAEMFLMSVSLAVAAIPEGLAAIVAVVLSIGVTGLSKKNAIVKKLPAVETLGSVNMICSDKTGTLTQNKMTVTTFYNLEGEMPVERNQKNTATADARLLAKALILSSDATFEKGHATGDPTEIALLLLGDDLGIDRKVLNEGSKRINEFSFDSDRKLMSTLVGEKGIFTVYTKGSIAGILSISTHVLEKGQVFPITEEHKELYRAAANSMANSALRTLGVAYKPADAKIPASEMEQGLILAGLVGMIDPPRAEVRESIQKAKTCGHHNPDDHRRP
ncbi:MAG: HAD-IC family P-type ATPase [Bacteroidales bacterium]|nr:HAD-IC family P-type ATPase [Bacteroidales bacterium]